MTRLADGLTREWADDWGFPGYVREEGWEFDPVFIWSDGNFSCDCNRALFFARAVDEPDPDLECGQSQYRVNWIRNDETGNIIYEEEAK
jgi:hypothetical protein